jgi:hypothetical protein
VSITQQFEFIDPDDGESRYFSHCIQYESCPGDTVQGDVRKLLYHDYRQARDTLQLLKNCATYTECLMLYYRGSLHLSDTQVREFESLLRVTADRFNSPYIYVREVSGDVSITEVNSVEPLNLISF